MRKDLSAKPAEFQRLARTLTLRVPPGEETDCVLVEQE